MRNFERFDGGNNIPGYVHFYFLPDDAIAYIPEQANGVVDLDDINYTGSDEWHVGASILKTLALGNEQKLTPDGPTYPVVIEGRSAKKSAHNLALFHEMSWKRWIVLIKDKNGNYFICGEPGNGLSFSWKEVEGALSFVFGGSYKQPCWFASGTVSLDGVAVGIDYIPATTTIIGVNGKSAYQIAVANGFVGTEAQWLASLIGPQGPTGPAGPQGPQGVGLRTYIDYRGGVSQTFAVQNTWYGGNRNTSNMAFLQLNTAHGTGAAPASSIVPDTNGLKLPFKARFLQARFSAKTSTQNQTYEVYIYANEEPQGSARGGLQNAQVLFQGTFTTGTGIDHQLDRVLTPGSTPTLLIFTKIYVLMRCTTGANTTFQHPELIMIFEEVI